jgi:hypothetical protein
MQRGGVDIDLASQEAVEMLIEANTPGGSSSVAGEGAEEIGRVVSDS